MTIETEIAGLTQATTDLLDAVNVRKATLDGKVTEATTQASLATSNGAAQVALAAAQVSAATTQANNAAASATAANTAKTAAETAKTAAETAKNAAVTAQNNAVAVVTGGAATLVPEAGKIPLADALGKISALWVALTALVEQSDIGTGPNQVPLNQFLGDLAYQGWSNLSMKVVDPSDVGSAPHQIPLNQFLGGMAFQSHMSVNIEGGILQGQVRRRAPVIKTSAFTVANNEHWLVCNGTASIAVTLPDPALNEGREIMLTNRAAFTVVSASSNVVPLVGGAAGTDILSATAGKYATLVSNGINWIITQAN